MNSRANLNGAGLAGSHFVPIRLLRSMGSRGGVEAQDKIMAMITASKRDKESLLFIKASMRKKYVGILRNILKFWFGSKF